MAYELLSQSRKLNKCWGEEGGGPIKRERESGVRGLESVLKKITGGTLIRDSRVIVNVVGFTNLFDSPK